MDGVTGRTRYARGTHRRAALVAAAAEFVLEHGLGALSHRAVAVRAGLPLASTTYYFTSLDDLRDEALSHVAEQAIDRATAVLDALQPRCSLADAAAAIAEMIGASAPTSKTLLLYERYLEAARHPHLRPLIGGWNIRLRELVGQVLQRAALPAGDGSSALVLALADGAAVTALAEGTAPHDAVTVALSRAFALMSAPPQQPHARPLPAPRC